MAKPTGPTNRSTRSLLIDLRKLSNQEKTNIWKAVAQNLAKPTRQRREVNLSKLEKYANDGETIVVPGKVLSNGTLTKKLTVAAFNFSQPAKEHINKTGKALTIRDLMKQNPTGKNVRIFG